MMTNTMRDLSSPEIVAQYLSFLRGRNHLEVPGSQLGVTGNSSSFIIAGMQSLLPYLRGQLTPPAPRLTALQRCLRTDDADAVGTNGRKNTCFHMLGNWAIGDYGKRETIEMALELLLGVFGLEQERLWVTTFKGDSELGIPPDEVSMQEWQRLGIPQSRIVPLGAEDNLWTMGGSGPCGSCSEIFVDRGVELICGLPNCQPGCSCERFLEIWNLVFMEYERFSNNDLVPLPLRNIDTGMGLERIATVMQETESIFTIDLFMPAMTHLLQIAPLGNAGGGSEEVRARRLILDHTRAALFAGFVGIEPGRDGRNSVVRRLIRRAARQGRVLSINSPFISELVMPLVEGHGGLLTTEEHLRVPTLVGMLADEERRFDGVLTLGLKYLAQLEPDEHGLVPGECLFELHAEKGFPVDLAAEILLERGLLVDWPAYERASEEHRRISRLSAERHFRSA